MAKRRKGRLALVLAGTAAAALVAGSCARHAAKSQAEAAVADKSAHGTLSAKVPEVKLLDPGEEPRALLRYAPTGSEPEELVVQLGLAGLFEAADRAVELDDLVLELALHVSAPYYLTDDLWASPFRLQVLGLATPDDITAEERRQLIEQLALLDYVNGVFQIDSRGITHRADLSVPPGVSPRLLTLLGHVRTSLITAPLPREAVGKGARWRMERPVQVGSLDADQTATYTLLERDGASVRIGVTTQQSARPQELALDSAGTKLEVEAYEVSTVGSSRIDLQSFIPVGELRGSSQLRATLRQGQQTAPVAVSGAVMIEVEPMAESEAAPRSGAGP